MGLRTRNCIFPCYFVIIIDWENHLLGPAIAVLGYTVYIIIWNSATWYLQPQQTLPISKLFEDRTPALSRNWSTLAACSREKASYLTVLVNFMAACELVLPLLTFLEDDCKRKILWWCKQIWTSRIPGLTIGPSCMDANFQGVLILFF